MTTTTPARRERWRFFLEHAGYCTPPGRAACALELARAEELLEDAIGLELARVRIEHDPEPYEVDDDVMSEAEVRSKFASNEWTGPFGVILELEEEHTASLWGIVVGPKESGDPYMRVVAAELADEHADELRQAIGDARDALELEREYISEPRADFYARLRAEDEAKTTA
jgi:hypothetical protein